MDPGRYRLGQSGLTCGTPGNRWRLRPVGCGFRAQCTRRLVNWDGWLLCRFIRVVRLDQLRECMQIELLELRPRRALSRGRDGAVETSVRLDRRLTIRRFSMKVCRPKSNGRMNRVFAMQIPSTRTIVSVGVVSSNSVMVVQAGDVRHVTFSFHS